MVRFQQQLHRYCEQHSTPPDAVLQALERVTHLRTLAPQMMSGHIQGQFLQWFSQLLRPKSILEIGTFTGYASICLARGLPPGGILHTIEVNPELAYISNEYFAKAGLSAQIKPWLGDAMQVVPSIPINFDLIFMDAGKRDYAAHYDLVIDRLHSGGYLLADNVLWSGKIVQKKTDLDTNALQAFNQKIQQDNRVENLMLPLRDGLLIVRKK